QRVQETVAVDVEPGIDAGASVVERARSAGDGVAGGDVELRRTPGRDARDVAKVLHQPEQRGRAGAVDIYDVDGGHVGHGLEEDGRRHGSEAHRHVTVAPAEAGHVVDPFFCVGRIVGEEVGKAVTVHVPDGDVEAVAVADAGAE